MIAGEMPHDKIIKKKIESKKEIKKESIYDGE